MRMFIRSLMVFSFIAQIASPLLPAGTNDHSKKAKAIAAKFLSDPNVFCINPPKDNNLYKGMSEKDISAIYTRSSRGGAVLSFFENGNPFRYTAMKNLKKHGLAKTWYPSGIVCYEEQYNTGKLIDGIYFDKSGSKLSEIKSGCGVKILYKPSLEKENWIVGSVEYKNGQRDGILRTYRNYKTKKKGTEAHFKEGKLHGVKTEWMSNGQKNTEEHYKKGLRHGKFTVWYENGQIQSSSVYVDGKILHPESEVSYHPNGQIESVLTRNKDGVLVNWKIYHENGQLKSDADYDDDGVETMVIKYYENGIEAERLNHNGRDLWFPSGQLMYTMKKKGRWGQIISGKSFDYMGNLNGKVTDGNGSLIDTFTSEIMEVSTLSVYKEGRLDKTIRLPEIKVGWGYSKGECNISLKPKFKNSKNMALIKGKVTLLLPEKCSSKNQLAFDVKNIKAGEEVDFGWMRIEIPEKVEKFKAEIIADIECVIDGCHHIRYQQILRRLKI